MGASTPALASRPPVTPNLLPSGLVDRLRTDQRERFLRLLTRMPVHVKGVCFDMHDPGWSPEAIDSLADAICD